MAVNANEQESRIQNEQISAKELSERLAVLSLRPKDLTVIMQKYGDHRTGATIIKGIKRMLSGETAVSGEIVVIVELIDKFRQAGESLGTHLEWSEVKEGCLVATHEGWTVTLDHIRRCWRVSIQEPNGTVLSWDSYSHLTNVEHAKSTGELRLWCALNNLGSGY